MKPLQDRNDIRAVIAVGGKQGAAKAFGGRDSTEPPMKKEFIYWPSPTALDRQLVEIGVPFIRDRIVGGRVEVLVIERTKSGGLKSTCVGRMIQEGSR